MGILKLLLVLTIIVSIVVLLWSISKIYAEKASNTKLGNNTYKKLSPFGKFVWFGIISSICIFNIGMNIAPADLITNDLPFISVLRFFGGIISLIIFFICAFFDGVYCNYEYKSEDATNIFSFSGRMPRSKFLKYFLVLFLAFMITTILHIPGIIMFPFWIAFYTAAVRRAQDFGDTPWTPFIPIYSLILFFVPGNKEDNEYGPATK